MTAFAWIAAVLWALVVVALVTDPLLSTVLCFVGVLVIAFIFDELHL